MSFKPVKTAIFALLLASALLPASAAIQVLAITSSTDFQIAALSPGSLASVWCTGLTGITGVITSEGPVFQTNLAGVSIYAGGAMNAPILGIADLGGYQLINIQIPWDAGETNAFVVMQGSERASAIMAGSSVWPVFFVDSNGRMLARHASDYSPVTTDNPAHAGEWIAGYASNLGPVSNTPLTGVDAPLAPLSYLAPVPPPNTGVDSTPSYSVVMPQPNETVVYETTPLVSNFIGLAPYTVGVYQVNFQIPLSPPTGDALVYMRKNVDCGFFFIQGCGRGLTTFVSASAKLPVAP